MLFLSMLASSAYQPRLAPETSAPVLGSCQLFPDNNYWNVPVENLPVHPNSSAWINSIGANDGFHMDFGSGTWDGGPIGIPYNIVSTEVVDEFNFDFYYPGESDAGPYPLPASPKIEHGSDHHILTVETDNCFLYEIYDASWDGANWSGGSGAIWDLNSNALRPDTWTSADAAGLAMLPGLARYEEVSNGIIQHALRFTANCTANYYLWPARHKAPRGSCQTPVPFGARFRLKADYDTSGFSQQAQVLLQAFKTYGIVLADNGSDWYVSGSPNPAWDNDQLHELDALQGSDFEAVDTSGWMVDPNTAETRHSETPYVYSVKRIDPNPTPSSTFRFAVNFSEPVTGVDPQDFDVIASPEIAGTEVGSVIGTGASYTVTVSISSGHGTIQLVVLDDDSIKEENGAATLSSGFNNGEVYTRFQTTTYTYLSVGAYDGRILESAESSNTGGSMDNAAATLILGDDASDRQYRAILHFGTSSLPDTAVITSAVLQMRMYNVTGTNPFTVLGSLRVAVRKPSFGVVALELADFKSAAGVNLVSNFNPAPVNSWYGAVLNSTGMLYINRSGTTQFRLYFTKDDSDNLSADHIRFYSGNASVAFRPKLIIQYYVP